MSSTGSSAERRPRVVMVIRLFYPWMGGTQRQAHRLARALLEEGIDVRIVTGWWFRGTPRREVVDGIPVQRVQTLWEFFGLKGLRRLGGYLSILTLAWHLWRRREEYDLIHVHGLSYHTFASVLAGRLARRPTITKLANSGSASDIVKMRAGSHLALSRLMLPRALRSDRFVALSDEIARELTAAGVPSDRVVTIPNGIDAGPPTGRDHALGPEPRLVFVGRLHEQKGLDTLLHALAELRRRRPDRPIRLDLVGDGPQRGELQDLAARLELGATTSFHGNRDDVEAFLRVADVFVLPSRAEGMSNALLEAMAAGLPVIASSIPANANVVRDGVDGLLCPPDRASELADAIDRLLADEAMRARLAAEARRTVEERYSMSSVVGRYVALYEEVCSGVVASAPADVSRDAAASGPSA